MIFRRVEPSDARLVQEVRRGRTQRFSELVGRYKNLVYATVLSRVRDPDDAAQDVFLTAFRQLDQLQPPGRSAPGSRVDLV